MKKFITAVLVGLLLLIPGSASRAGLLDVDPASLAKWAGCHATVVTSNDYSPLRSMYFPGGSIYIGTMPGIVSREGAIAIAFHEITHCLQDQNYPAIWDDRVATELDADRGSADLMCRYGMDGKRILRELFEWFKSMNPDWDGDDNHGTMAQRISQGELAEACRVVPVQTP
jgi:hypothetical protein